MSRSRRRMILPLRVLGSASVKRRSSGRAKAPISLATCSRSAFLRSSLGFWLDSSVTKAAIAWPFSSSGRPTPAASATAGWLTSALLGHYAGERERRRAGLGRDGAGEGRDHDAARLRLPPGVDDRAALAADQAMVPHPCLGVDGLAHRAEEAERGEVVLARPRLAPLAEGADRGRRGVEHRDAELLDDLPAAVRLRMVDHRGARRLGVLHRADRED